jgi:hypothetical protein
MVEIPKIIPLDRAKPPPMVRAPGTELIHAGEYDRARCPTCGRPWSEHDDTCSRHAYRFLYECRGHERGGVYECCSRAGEYNGFASDGPTSFTCPHGCSCHD